MNDIYHILSLFQRKPISIPYVNEIITFITSKYTDLYDLIIKYGAELYDNEYIMFTYRDNSESHEYIIGKDFGSYRTKLLPYISSNAEWHIQHKITRELFQAITENERKANRLRERYIGGYADISQIDEIERQEKELMEYVLSDEGKRYYPQPGHLDRRIQKGRNIHGELEYYVWYWKW